MPQLFVIVPTGQVAEVLPDGRAANSSRMRWPIWVRLLVVDDPTETLEAARDAETGKVYVDLDALTDEQLALLSIEDAVECDLKALALSGSGKPSSKLELSTEGREAERAAYFVFVLAEQKHQDEAALPDKLAEMGFKKEAAQVRKSQKGVVDVLKSVESQALSNLEAAASAAKERAEPIAEVLRADMKAARANQTRGQRG